MKVIGTNKSTASVVNFISSKWFFVGTITLFAIQAIWLAASAAYPMLYDEYYHPGLIDIYSHQWSPIIDNQTPEQTAVYMDITRVPSYLYHYLLSFPYRFISIFTDSFYVKIVSLRLINIAMVIGGLIFFRRLFSRLNISRSVSNVGLLILTLLPLFVHLSAHVNYDNLLFLLAPILFIYAINILEENKKLFIKSATFLLIGLVGTLVKINFLPIFASSALYIIITILIKKKKNVVALFNNNFRDTSLVTKIILCSLLVIMAGLFAERHIGNLVRYGSIQPTCQIIHSADDCIKQPVIKRGVEAKKRLKESNTELDTLGEYTSRTWLPAMIKNHTLVSSNIGSEEEFGYTVKRSEGSKALPIIFYLLWIGSTLGSLMIVYYLRELRRLPWSGIIMTGVIVYLLTIWLYVNYSTYQKNGEPFGIQPRYLLLVTPILLALGVQAVNYSLRSKKIKILLFTLCLLLFTQGGGIATYIIRSNEGWYWQRKNIIDTNMKIKRIIQPLIKEN